MSTTRRKCSHFLLRSQKIKYFSTPAECSRIRKRINTPFRKYVTLAIDPRFHVRGPWTQSREPGSIAKVTYFPETYVFYKRLNSKGFRHFKSEIRIVALRQKCLFLNKKPQRRCFVVSPQLTVCLSPQQQYVYHIFLLISLTKDLTQNVEMPHISGWRVSCNKVCFPVMRFVWRACSICTHCMHGKVKIHL